MRQSRIVFWGLILAVLLFSYPAAATDGNASAVQGNSGNVEWSVYGQTGFQRMNLDFNASFPRGIVPGPAVLFHPSPLDISMHNANLWTGGIGADVKKGSLSGFLDLKASLPRNINTSTTSEPFWGGIFPVDWQHSHLTWWGINAGAGVDITNHVAIRPDSTGNIRP